MDRILFWTSVYSMEVEKMKVKEIQPYALRMVKWSYYERGMRNELYDPFGLGVEFADDIVHVSHSKKDILDNIKLAEDESKQQYLSPQLKKYYASLIDELKSYARKNKRALDMYRRR